MVNAVGMNNAMMGGLASPNDSNKWYEMHLIGKKLEMLVTIWKSEVYSEYFDFENALKDIQESIANYKGVNNETV